MGSIDSGNRNTTMGYRFGYLAVTMQSYLLAHALHKLPQKVRQVWPG